MEAGRFPEMPTDQKCGIATMWTHHVIITSCNVKDLAPLLLEHQLEQL